MMMMMMMMMMYLPVLLRSWHDETAWSKSLDDDVDGSAITGETFYVDHHFYFWILHTSSPATVHLTHEYEARGLRASTTKYVSQSATAHH